MRWLRNADLGSRCVWSVANIPFCRKSALPGNVRFHVQGHRRRCSVPGSPAFACCTNEPVRARAWVMAAKQLEGFRLNCSSENSAAFLGFSKGDGGGEEQPSVSHAQICRSQLICFITALPSLVANLFAVITLRKQRQLQTIYYPLVTLPLK